MCGRYFVDEAVFREAETLVQAVDRGFQKDAGERYPSGSAAVICGRNSGLRLEQMRWGLVRQDKKRLLINARAETVLERKTFLNGVRTRRCIIPARSFYEWDRDKTKVTFYREDHRTVYMAGFYNCLADGCRFVILTTQANDTVSPVHHRMPLVLEKGELNDWVYDDRFLDRALHKIPARMERVQEYRQLCLF